MFDNDEPLETRVQGTLFGGLFDDEEKRWRVVMATNGNISRI